MSVNKAILIGNLCSDPTIRFTPSGDSIATLNIATNRRWKDKNGEKKEEAEFHRVTLFGALAKVAGDYTKKGSKIYIEGRIKTDKYQKDGQDVYTTGIIGESLQLLDSRSGENGQYTEQKPAQSPKQPAQQYDVDDDISIPF